MTSRRTFLQRSTGALASALLGFPALVRAKAESRPNVLIILSDQERELADRQILSLPHRQRLEDRGLRFSRAFCNTPQCSASRASLWTGLYPHETGVFTNVDGSSLGVPLSPTISNLGNVFARQGYQTGYLGKWHLGNDKEGLAAFGFESDPRGAALRGEPLAEAAREWMESRSASPWLLIVSFLNPHDINHINEALRYPIREGVELPDNFKDSLHTKPSPQLEFLEHDQGQPAREWGADEWRRYRSFYLELIEKVDAHVGIMLDSLERKGEADRTIVVYLSDHGDMGGAHGLPLKGPFTYEELINVPLVISHPERFPKPATTSALASLVDLAPTLCRMTGVSWGDRQSGLSLDSLFEHPEAERRDEIVVEYYSKQKWVNPIRTIRTTQWKYNRYLNGGEELYNLRNDPGELKNLAGNPFFNDMKREMAGRLARWQEQTNDPYR